MLTRATNLKSILQKLKGTSTVDVLALRLGDTRFFLTDSESSGTVYIVHYK